MRCARPAGPAGVRALVPPWVDIPMLKPPGPSRQAAAVTCASCAIDRLFRVNAPRLSEFIKAYDVRGLVPQQLNDAVAFAIGSAFAQGVARPDGAGPIVVRSEGHTSELQY